MKRLVNILVCFVLASSAIAQEDTHVVDSLLGILPSQEGREKVETMMELSKAFFGYSFDDCIDWGEKAIEEARNLGFADLEADATSSLGELYGDHADNDLAQEYLREAQQKHLLIGKEQKAIDDLWSQAYYEQVYGNIDTSYCIYEKIMEIADRNKDSLLTAKSLINMAIIQYQSLRFNQAERSFLNSRRFYVCLNDSLMITKIDANLACLYMEWGNPTKARKLFLDVIPKIEAIGDYGLLITAYKNFGQLFVKDYYDFDSASYYFDKAYSVVDFLEANGVEVPENVKVDLLVEMGNAFYNDDNFKEAENIYLRAFDLAESSSNASAQMMACLGLGMVYSHLSQPSKSLHYLNMIEDLESESGIMIAYSTIKAPLILNYGRVGKFDEMESELKDFKDEYDGLQRENRDLYDQIGSLQDETQGLLQQYDTQNAQIKTLQTQRNHYRLAFFGLLALVLFAVVLFLAYKIVRKKRAKSVNP